MKHVKRLAAVAAFLLATSAAAPVFASDIAALHAAAAKDEIAWSITEGLSTEIGARPAGSEAEARARAWGAARLKALGFSNVRIETFDVPLWSRSAATAEIVSPFPQRLTLTALGGSGSTPPGGVDAEVVPFDSVAALEAAPDATVRGKIVYVTHDMKVVQDTSEYDRVGPIRRMAPSIAARKGAAAILIKSLGTDRSRQPHTGIQRWANDVSPIPAAALSVSDALQIERIFTRGKPVRLKLDLVNAVVGRAVSGNLIAEVPGREPRAGIILVGCHLDSWDLGTGALDDAIGCGIVTAAAKLLMEWGQPLRTIRVVWFGAEEIGLLGGAAYLQKNGVDDLAIVAESDLGGGRVTRFSHNLGASVPVAVGEILRGLARLGVEPGTDKAEGYSDVGPLVTAGAPLFVLEQDTSDYFAMHHTAEDVLERVNHTALRQNIAAWVTVLNILSQLEEL